MKRSVVAAVVAAVVAIAVPAARSGASQTGCAVTSPSRAGATIAKAVVAADVFVEPGAGVRVWRAATQTPWGHNPTWLLVLGCATDQAGREWLRVLLPIRPNGSTGWIRADFVLLGHSDYSVEVRVGHAQVAVFKGGRLVRRVGAVVGARATPTPVGLFAVYDPVLQPRPEGFVGPWVIHLTGHSDVLDDFGGGPGRIAIHGRGAASLRVPLGSAASHGCIRVDSDVVSWLARTLPMGTPVVVRP
jgi:L,D-transpeptidase catalytic domain